MIILVEDHLQEKLVPATQQEFDSLKAQIATDPMLQKQLKTRLGDLPQYQYLYEMDWVDDISLLDVLELIDRENLFEIMFVKSGVKFTGFLAYKDDGQQISKIKMASFFDDQIKANRTIVADMLVFIESGMKNHNSIQWTASRNNPVNSLYMKVIPKKFPQYKFKRSWNSRLNKWDYLISK
jgi:hypothetical protein